MSLERGRCFRILGVLAVTVACCGSVRASDNSYVKPPIELETAQFVPSALMQGQAYRVEARAVNDGYVNSYRLQTEWGEAEAVSDYRLRVRIREVQALKTLDEMSRAGVFGESLAKGALAPVTAVVDLVTEPVGTVTGAVEGVGRWFGNIASSVTSRDPYQEGAASAAAGWAQTKRAFAVELAVDPYTDWQPLQEALASVGRAAFAGGISAKVALGAVTRGTPAAAPVAAFGLTDSMKKKLIDNPPERLAQLHRGELAELGMSNDAIELFIANYHYSPMEKLLLVEALKRMKGAEGLGVYLAHAAAAPDKTVARFMQQRGEMMAKLYEEASPTSIIRLTKVPMQRTGDGRVIGVFPIDYLPWTSDLDTILRGMTDEVSKLSDVAGREIWIEGVVSPETRSAMEALGWKVRDGVGLLMTAS